MIFEKNPQKWKPVGRDFNVNTCLNFTVLFLSPIHRCYFCMTYTCIHCLAYVWLTIWHIDVVSVWKKYDQHLHNCLFLFKRIMLISLLPTNSDLIVQYRLVYCLVSKMCFRIWRSPSLTFRHTPSVSCRVRSFTHTLVLTAHGVRCARTVTVMCASCERKRKHLKVV